MPLDAIAAALADAGRVPGRFEPVDEGQDFGVLVDYAHTPDSLENVLRAARELDRAGGCIVVFGAGGDRDRDKRPLMGEAAAAPRRPRDRHLRQPALGGPGARSSTRSSPGAGRGRRARGRTAARAIALRRGRRPRPGDVVVIAGKGHEQGQEFEGGRKEPFDDVTVAREALRARLGGAA